MTSIDVSAVGTAADDRRPLPSTVDLSSTVERSLRAKRRSSVRRSVLVRVGQLAVVVVLLGGWEFASTSGLLPNADLFYSKPSAIGLFLFQNAGELAVQTMATLQAALLGLVFGVVLGGVSGLVLGRLHTVDRILDPIITVLAGIPRIALAPLFLLWFGISLQAKVFLAFSLVYFIVLLNARAGVRTVDPELQTVARLLGAPRWKVMSMVIIPGSSPVLLGTLRLAVVFSVLGVIASEMVSATSGLGIAVVSYGQNLNPAGVFSVLAILAVLMAILNGLIRFVEIKVLSWREDG